MGRTFLNAGAQSTCASPITNAQTTVVLASTALFGAPSILLPSSVVLLDAGNPAFDKNNPFATNFEYQPVTNNNTGTNTVTFNNGVRGNYAGTTPKSFLAGAIVAAVFLPDDITASFPQNVQTVSPSGSPATGSILIPSWANHIMVKGQGRGDAAAQFVDVQVFLNADTTVADYTQVQLVGNNAVASSSSAGSLATIARIPAATAIAGDGGTFTVELFNPQGATFFHEVHGFGSSYETGGASGWYDIFRSVHWNSAAAVASFALQLTAGNWLAGSKLFVYAWP